MRLTRIGLLGTAALCGFIGAAAADGISHPQPASSQNIVLAQASAPPNTAAATSGGSAIETVTVTAQRRSEDIQRVPVAVTALEGSALDTQGIVGFQSLSFRRKYARCRSHMNSSSSLGR